MAGAVQWRPLSAHVCQGAIGGGGGAVLRRPSGNHGCQGADTRDGGAVRRRPSGHHGCQGADAGGGGAVRRRPSGDHGCQGADAGGGGAVRRRPSGITVARVLMLEVAGQYGGGPLGIILRGADARDGRAVRRKPEHYPGRYLQIVGHVATQHPRLSGSAFSAITINSQYLPISGREMFESHAIERVRCDEVEFSEPVLQYESIYRINVLHSHPSFLVELPWLINRVDLSVDKYPHFKLYLEPYGDVVKCLVEALGRLETSLVTHIRRVCETGQEMLMKSMIESEDRSGAQYISVRVPQRHMYMCFDESGAGIDIGSIKRGQGAGMPHEMDRRKGGEARDDILTVEESGSEPATDQHQSRRPHEVYTEPR